MHDKKDDWSVGATKNNRSISCADKIPNEKKEEYQNHRFTSDKFSMLPPNHPHEIKENRKNV